MDRDVAHSTITSPSCWPITGPRALVAALAAGQLDDALDAVIEAVNARTRALAEERKQAALARLVLHGRVRFADTARPQYLRGATGEIHELEEDLVVVCLDAPVGKFRSGHVRTAPELLQPIQDT